MLKIRSSRPERELVQAIAAEYIEGKFHELRGDYDTLMVRLDALAVSLEKLKKEAVAGEDLIVQVDEHGKKVAEMRKEVTERLDTYENERLGILEHRLDDLENHLGF